MLHFILGTGSINKGPHPSAGPIRKQGPLPTPSALDTRQCQVCLGVCVCGSCLVCVVYTCKFASHICIHTHAGLYVLHCAKSMAQIGDSVIKDVTKHIMFTLCCFIISLKVLTLWRNLLKPKV